MIERFKNQTVIITGGSNGIGEGISKAFGNNDANICIADVDEKKGSEVLNQIKEVNQNVFFYKTDLRNEEDIMHLMKKVKEQFGKVDILINNAGVSRFKPLVELTTNEWDDVINTNLRGTFIASREASKMMPRGGRIINMASTRAIMSEPNSEAYAASKGGIVALTHSLAASLQSKGITVNCISPGWIQNVNYNELSEKDHLQHWSNRVGTPDDIALACLYLADPKNNFINGQNIIVDGGMTRKMIYEE